MNSKEKLSFANKMTGILHGISISLGLIIKHHSDNKGNCKGQKVMQPTQLFISF